MHFLCALLVMAMAPHVLADGSPLCQERSSSGRKYMLAVMDTYTYAFVRGIFISIAANNDGHVNVSAPFIRHFHTYRLKNGVTTITLNSEVIATNNGTEHKGILLEADIDVMVSVVVDGVGGGEQEGYLALPLPNDDTSTYIVSSWLPDNPSVFLVASAKDNTTVTITSFGTTHQTVILNKFETYQMKFKHVDPSGTYILATGPVSVFSGSQCSDVLLPYCQALTEQLAPVSSWGKSHITPALQSKHWNVVRVYTANDTATVTLANSTSTKALHMSSFDYTTIIYQDEPLWIQSDTPVQVIQYSTGKDDGNVGDTFMMTIPDVNSFLSEYKIKPPAIFTRNVHQPVYVTVTINQTHESGLRLNGHTLTNISRHDVAVTSQGNYSVITVRLTVEVEYVLRHQTPGITFGGLLYGYPSLGIAYGYPLGMKLHNYTACTQTVNGNPGVPIIG